MADAYGGTKQTLIEEGTSLKGTITSECPVLVRGQVEGELNTPALAVSSSGSVQGKVKVGELRSEGELAGEVDADTVALSGRVRDNTVIRAKTLEVKLVSDAKMQVMFGDTELSVGDEPSDQKSGKKKRGKNGSLPPDAGEPGATPD